LQGATVGSSIRTTPHFAPRIGFNYDVNGKKSTQIRGGLGVFTSRLPLVWPGGTYNNNGVSQGAIYINTSVIRCNSCNDAVFNPNPSVAKSNCTLTSSFQDQVQAVGWNVSTYFQRF
jgi:hypothetical protein